MTEIPIATRKVLDVATAKSIIITIFQPVPTSDFKDWACQVSLATEDNSMKSRHDCFGVDAIQAIHAAFAYIRQEIGANHVWLDENALLGFPATLPTTYGLSFYQRVEKMIRDEEHAFVDEALQKRGTSRKS